MSDKSEEYEALSTLQKQIASMITQFPEIPDSEIANKVVKEDGSHPSKSYVGKIRKRLGITPTEAQARELTIEVEKELPEVPEEAQAEGDRTQGETPTEELRFPEMSPNPEAPTAPTPTLEDDALLRPIFTRSLDRLLNETLMNRILKIQEKLADKQALEDLEVLLVINLKRFGGIALTGDNLLYATDISFIGSLGINSILAWREKKAKEKPIPPQPQEKPPEEPKTPEHEEPRIREKNDPTNRPNWAKEGSPLIERSQGSES